MEAGVAFLITITLYQPQEKESSSELTHSHSCIIKNRLCDCGMVLSSHSMIKSTKTLETSLENPLEAYCRLMMTQ